MILGKSQRTTVGVLPRVVTDLYVHRDNGVNDENTELLFGKWVVPQNSTIGGGSLSDRLGNRLVIPKGLGRRQCQTVEDQGAIDKRIANSLIERRTPDR